MKLLVAVVLLPLVTSAQSVLRDGSLNPFDARTMFKECLEKFKWTQNGSIIYMDESKTKEEDNQKIRCFEKCKLEESGLWKDGGLDLEESEGKLLNRLPNAKEDIKECASIKGDDDCDTGMRTLICLRSKIFPPQPVPALLRDGSLNPFNARNRFNGCLDKFGWTQNGSVVHIGKLQRKEAKKLIGCFRRCKMEESGIWRNGCLDIAASEEKLQSFENAEEALQECSALRGTDDCDTASQAFVCLKIMIFPPPLGLPPSVPAVLPNGSPNPFDPKIEFKDCLEKFGWTQNGSKVYVGKLEDEEAKEQIKCFKQCKLEASGLWKDGGIDTSTAEEQLIETIPNAKESIQECAAKKELMTVIQLFGYICACR